MQEFNREVHNASLVSITPNAEEQIVYMARVSNPKNQKNLDTAPKLIKYLIKAGHWSASGTATSRNCRRSASLTCAPRT